MSGRLEITGLFTYPIKSCRGISHRELAFDDFGPEWDRRWMVVDANGQFLTQRKFPQMAQIRVSVGTDSLTVETPGQGSSTLEAPFSAARNDRTQVVIWKDTSEAWDEGQAAADWFSEFLGLKVRLVRMPDDFMRPVNPKYATRAARVSFADAYPALLATEESLGNLNDRLQERGAQPITMDRFRPNIVVRGGAPWAEDSWKQLRHLTSDLLVDMLKPCVRCPIPTTDQMTGEIPEPGEPLATLATFRRWEGGVIFAQNVLHSGPGRLKVGDFLEVVR